MAQERKPSSRVAFGPFQADLHTGELRKRGVNLRLAEQPFQILAALLERPGDLVTREQLRERLWSEDTFVAFDDSLNAAVNKLRQTLGDSARDPKYIETLQGRGYRFVGETDQADLAGKTESSSIRAAAGDEVSPENLVPKRKLYLPWAAATVAAVVALAISVVYFRQTPSELPLRRFAYTPPAAISAPVSVFSTAVAVAISPNGKHIAFTAADAAGKRLWIQDLDRGQPRAIEGTEGAAGPFWSPHSDFIAFAAGRELKKVPVQGGLVTRLCQMPNDSEYFSGGSWSPDGEVIVFSSNFIYSLFDPHPPMLYEISARGGTPNLLTSAQESEPSTAELPPGIAPHFLPVEAGHRVLLFTAGTSRQTMMIQDLETGRREILGSGHLPFYSPSGHVVYQSGPNSYDLWALPFSLQTLQPTGEAFPIAQNSGQPTVSTDGTLVYLDVGSRKRELAWFDRQGEKVGEIDLQQEDIVDPSLSPDGRLVAVSAIENSNFDVWVYDITHAVKTRLSTTPEGEFRPIWSPTGDEVAFATHRAGNFDIFLRQADGSREVKKLFATPNHDWVCDWSRDGKYILYEVVEAGTAGTWTPVSDPETGGDLWYLERNGESGWEPYPFVQTPYNETTAKFSPDGRFVAYSSNESGQYEVYVRPFPDGGQKFTVSTNAGQQPRWSPNGKELFYVEGTTLVAVALSTSPTFSIHSVTRLFEHPRLTRSQYPHYDVSADGQRFLIAEPVGDAAETSIRVVQNWFAEFRDRERD